MQRLPGWELSILTEATINVIRGVESREGRWEVALATRVIHMSVTTIGNDALLVAG